MTRGTGAGPGASRTRHSQAAAMIGQRIVSGEWTAGNALPTEADLSRELNVSRASLREAIKLLAGKGLIKLDAAPRHHRPAARDLEPPRPRRAVLAGLRGPDRRSSSATSSSCAG